MILAALRLLTPAAAVEAHPPSRPVPATAADDLVARARRGDPRASRELLERGGRLAASVIVNVIGRSADHDDLVQEAMVRTFQRLDQLDEPKALFSFVRAIAVNVARESLRARRRRWWWRLAPTAELPEREGEDPREGRAALAAVEHAVSQLEVEQRVAFGLRYLEGLSIAEAAAAMGVSAGTFKRRLAEAERTIAAACPELGLRREEEQT